MKIKYFEDNNIDINYLDSCIYQAPKIPNETTTYPLVLDSIGRKHPQQHINYKRTNHTFINFCIDGSGELRLNGKTYEITPGTCMIISQGTPVEYFPTQEVFTTYWMAIRGNYIDKLLTNLNICFTLTDVNELIEDWYNIYNLPKNADWAIECSSLLYKYALKLNRQMKIALQININSSNNKLQAITDYFSHAVSSPYSLDTLSEQFHLSPAYICRIFKKAYNMTPNEFFEQQKIKYATDLLKSNDFSINEVAFSCGYNDSNYFSHIFKKHTGMSPSQYRKHVSKEQQ